MAIQKFTTIEEYISSFTPEIQIRLRSVQEAIKIAIPEAVEVISYNIPCFKFEKRFLIYFSAYKAHLSISIPPSGWDKKFEKELKLFKTSKSAIQFPYSQETPFDLIQKLARFRFEEKSSH